MGYSPWGQQESDRTEYTAYTVKIWGRDDKSKERSSGPTNYRRALTCF